MRALCFTILVGVLTLSSCDEAPQQSQEPQIIRDAKADISSRYRSAQFRNLVVLPATNTQAAAVCGELSYMDANGQYSGFKRFWIRPFEGPYQFIIEMDPNVHPEARTINTVVADLCGGQ
jgi:hypothetical protein